MNTSFLSAAFIIVLTNWAGAAVVMPDLSRMIWNYSLVQTGFGSDARDSFAVTLGDDRLGPEEILLISVTPTGYSAPTYTSTSYGSNVGTYAILFSGNLDLAFPTREGSVAIEIFHGSVDVHRIAIILNSSAYRLTASDAPNIYLVPEPGIPVMLMTTALGWLRRTRISRHSLLQPE